LTSQFGNFGLRILNARFAALDLADLRLERSTVVSARCEGGFSITSGFERATGILDDARELRREGALHETQVRQAIRHILEIGLLFLTPQVQLLTKRLGVTRNCFIIERNALLRSDDELDLLYITAHLRAILDLESFEGMRDVLQSMMLETSNTSAWRLLVLSPLLGLSSLWMGRRWLMSLLSIRRLLRSRVSWLSWLSLLSEGWLLMLPTWSLRLSILLWLLSGLLLRLLSRSPKLRNSDMSRERRLINRRLCLIGKTIEEARHSDCAV
jgi:hypothetical protein